MKSRIALSLSFCLLGACASTGPVSDKKSATPGLGGETKPTYSEKVGAVNVDELRAGVSCPAAKWEGADWRQVVAYASACVRAKDWRRVEALGNHLAMRASLTPWGAYFLSLAASERKDFPRAEWMLELAMKKAPNEGLLHYQLGRVQWESGEVKAALKSLAQAAELNPGLTDAHFLMGQLAFQKEDYSGAEKHFRRALANDAKHFPSLMAVSAIRLKKSDWSAAESALEEAVRANPKSSKARLALGQVQEMHLKKLFEALATYREIRGLAARRQLDETVELNLEEKIKSLEKSTAALGGEKVSARQPSANPEGQVAK